MDKKWASFECTDCGKRSRAKRRGKGRLLCDNCGYVEHNEIPGTSGTGYITEDMIGDNTPWFR